MIAVISATRVFPHHQHRSPHYDPRIAPHLYAPHLAAPHLYDPHGRQLLGSHSRFLRIAPSAHVFVCDLWRDDF